METGKLDQRIELKALTEVNNGGELTQSYATFATVFAHVMSQRGSEAFEAARTNAKEIVRVKIRYRTDVNTKTRFSWLGQNYNVTYIDRSNRRDGYLWFTGELKGAL